MIVKFFTNGDLPHSDVDTVVTKKNPKLKLHVINPSFLFLKHFHDLHGLCPDVKWLLPDLLMVKTIHEVETELIRDKPDIIGLGCYIWNISFQLSIARLAKKILPNCKIVAGGPQLIAHRDGGEDFFIKNPYIDYVVYGDGERAFQQIIDFQSGYITDKSQFVNIVENNNGERVIYPYEQLIDEEYMSSSAFVNNKQLLIDMINDLATKGIEKSALIFSLEFARGCMYNCTFCDWSQNLTKKVKRKKHPWKDDIDLFHELDVMIRETDANFGQWNEDLEIYKYALSLFDPDKNFRFPVYNTPKLKKSASEFLLTNTLKHYGFSVNISLQDTNQEVLRIIERPSVSWEEHIEMFNRIKQEVGPEKEQYIQAQIITGLPGQTYDSVVETYKKLYFAGLKTLSSFRWNFLPNSPANEPTYIKLHGIKLIDTVYIHQEKQFQLTDLEDLYSKIDTNDNSITVVPDVFETKLLNFEEMIAVRFFHHYYSNFLLGHSKSKSKDKVEAMFKSIKLTAKKEAVLQAELHLPLIKKYGFYIYGIYDRNQKTFYSKTY